MLMGRQCVVWARPFESRYVSADTAHDIGDRIRGYATQGIAALIYQPTVPGHPGRTRGLCRHGTHRYPGPVIRLAEFRSVKPCNTI
jgi:hypothetical protein